MAKRRILIMGAAGRDFHNFNVAFRDDPACEVVAFTATQIPRIEGRVYPPELAGTAYPQGIPIYPESELPSLIAELQVEEVIFAYSDVSHEYVMHKASRVLAAGTDFRLMGSKATMLQSSRPVISVGAVRTGSGKSQTTRHVCRILKDMGHRPTVVRHPMPYGDLTKQVCQRFASYEDLDRWGCTIEEREEYEPHLARGTVVYAGVDYEQILRQVEQEADIIVWDGGNNDLPFLRPDLHIVVVDPHRPDHEITYHPGEANLLLADVVVINKIDTADLASIASVRQNVRQTNPQAIIVEAASPIFADDPQAIRDKSVLVIEDGPTLTHGGMPYGAGFVAAQRFGAASIVDPRPHAVGSIAQTFAAYPHIGAILPAMGYGREQMAELAETINNTPCDLVIIATPVDLSHLLEINRPTQRIGYELQVIGQPTLREILASRVGSYEAT
jgi:predicted GTPase